MDRDGNPTGEVRFRNPDMPGQYLTRSEATAWVRDYNSEVKDAYNRMVRERIGELDQQYRPAMELNAFIPRYQKMDKGMQEAFMEAVEPYAIKQGQNIIGYKCDLNRMADQLDKLYQRWHTEPQETKPVQTPEVDIKSGSAATAGETKEPKDLSEAMMMLRSQKKGK